MAKIEKTVFISYRRTNAPWALAIFQNLRNHHYDVFFDFNSIASGDFEQVILGNIRARAHFIVLLTPSALENCDEPEDWLRREIEAALKYKRNIVPIMLENFDFKTPAVARRLTGNLAALKRYGALRVHPEYFMEAMDRLRQDFLNVDLKAVLHPASPQAKRSAKDLQAFADTVPAVAPDELIAQQWFEQGVAAADPAKRLRFYNNALALKPDYSFPFIDWYLKHNPEGTLPVPPRKPRQATAAGVRKPAPAPENHDPFQSNLGELLRDSSLNETPKFSLKNSDNAGCQKPDFTDIFKKPAPLSENLYLLRPDLEKSPKDSSLHEPPKFNLKGSDNASHQKPGLADIFKKPTSLSESLYSFRMDLEKLPEDSSLPEPPKFNLKGSDNAGHQKPGFADIFRNSLPLPENQDPLQTNLEELLKDSSLQKPPKFRMKPSGDAFDQKPDLAAIFKNITPAQKHQNLFEATGGNFLKYLDLKYQIDSDDEVPPDNKSRKKSGKR